MHIGIDPGPVTSTAVSFYNGRVVSNVELSVRELMDFLDYSSTQRPLLACEWIECYGMPVGKEVFETVHNIGMLTGRFPWMRLIPRRDIKMNLCHSTRAKDANVRQALLDRLGPVGTKKQPGPCYGVSKHAWAALAVAVTAYDKPVTDHEATFHRKLTSEVA